MNNRPRVSNRRDLVSGRKRSQFIIMNRVTGLWLRSEERRGEVDWGLEAEAVSRRELGLALGLAGCLRLVV